jgi:hypothetical protein
LYLIFTYANVLQNMRSTKTGNSFYPLKACKLGLSVLLCLFHELQYLHFTKWMIMNFDTTESELRKQELIRTLEHSIERLALPELEALYYDMVAKDYIR